MPYTILVLHVGLFYYVLGNIRPKYRSMLKAIQLIALVTNPLLNEYGFEKVLSQFITDVNKLTEVYVHVLFTFDPEFTIKPSACKVLTYLLMEE